MQNLIKYFQNILKSFAEPQTVTVWNKNIPEEERQRIMAKRQASSSPSAFEQATNQGQLPPEAIKLVPISQKKTEAIMGGDTSTSQPKKVVPRNPSFINFNVSPEVQNALVGAATKYGVPAELLFDIALQESSFDPHLINSTPKGKEAGNPTGLFQFTDDTWDTILNQYNNRPGMTLNLSNTNRLDPNTNAMVAAYLIKNGQLGKWDASEDVWGNYWTPQELESQGFYNQSKYHVSGVRPSIRLKDSY